MYKGGSNYTPSKARAIRYAGLIAPIIFISYGVLIQSGFIYSTSSTTPIGFLVISFWMLYLGIIQFLLPSATKFESMIRLIAYHLIAGSFLLFFSGIDSPLVGCWLILIIASNIYFSRRGALLSVLFFILIVILDIYMWPNITPSTVVTDLLTLVGVLLTAMVTISISASKEVSRGDLDHSKALEALQRDRILTIVNNLTVGVLSTDKHGIIRVYNAASLNLLDTNDSLNGKHIENILHVKDQSGTPVNIFEEVKLAKGAVKRDDLTYSFSDGEEMRLEVTYSAIKSSYSRKQKGETTDGYILIMQDVTKAKSLEEERDEFISVVSHELRTPLTIAEGSLSNVQVMMDHPDITKKMLHDSVDLAHEQVMFLANMVNDLSTLSRAERGASDVPELISVKDLAHKLHEEYDKEATGKKLHLDLDLSATLGSVYTSRLYLEELLQNFVTNALKYTKEGKVTISFRQKDGQIVLAVKDTGIGISKSDQTKIYDKFYRSEDYRTRETGGTGLGLYVATKLAHKVGTTIKLSSRLNHGSTFSITLPVSKKTA